MKTITTILALALASGCLGGGAKQRGGDGDDELEELDCKGRRATYVLAGGFVAPELGIQIACEDNRPSLLKWTADADGKREEARYELARAEFEETWRAFEDAGWRNLGDCVNTAAGDTEQIYSFEIADDDAQVSFACQGKQQPFPYDRLVNALDIAAGAVE